MFCKQKNPFFIEKISILLLIFRVLYWENSYEPGVFDKIIFSDGAIKYSPQTRYVPKVKTVNYCPKSEAKKFKNIPMKVEVEKLNLHQDCLHNFFQFIQSNDFSDYTMVGFNGMKFKGHRLISYVTTFIFLQLPNMIVIYY